MFLSLVFVNLVGYENLNKLASRKEDYKKYSNAT